MGGIAPTLNCLKSNNDELEQKIAGMETDIKLIKENHLYHIQADMNQMNLDIREIKRDIRNILDRIPHQ